jgi:ribosome-binding protein aMBF1 (putative translation factor)
MIKNEKQHRITKAQVRRFQDALTEMAGQVRPANISPRLWEAQRQAAQSQMSELQELVEAYERLHVGQGKEVLLEAVEDLPSALIRARIAAGITQEGLARRLGVKPQQIQRYESTDYQSASFARVVKVVQALGLKMPKAVRLVRNG